MTHSSDLAKALVGLLGLPHAVGDSFTITSEEYLPWNTIYQMFADAAGAPPPGLVHIASETIAAAAPELGPPPLGDRSHSVIFDNSKVKALVPEFVCTTPYATGVRDRLSCSSSPSWPPTRSDHPHGIAIEHHRGGAHVGRRVTAAGNPGRPLISKAMPPSPKGWSVGVASPTDVDG